MSFFKLALSGLAMAVSFPSSAAPVQSGKPPVSNSHATPAKSGVNQVAQPVKRGSYAATKDEAAANAKLQRARSNGKSR